MSDRVPGEVTVRTIDIHAHLTPQGFLRAIDAGKSWHGIKPGQMYIRPRVRWTPRQRLDDMNSLGVDVQVVSTAAAFYQYEKAAATTTAMHRNVMMKYTR